MKDGMFLLMKLGILLAATAAAHDTIVHLGYATYRGEYNATFHLNIWKGIRYAAAPVEELRWQPPQPPPPPSDNTSIAITPAVDLPPLCPQTGAYGLPPAYGFNSAPGDEDCLFLNVYAAPNASALPVLVWIHGGGYGMFGARYDPSAWINANENGFVVVEMQYRLGAFGFLASPDVRSRGSLNVGLLDQRFALEWVRSHIAKFGGDPGRVTVGGESSGASSAVFHALAHGGRDSGLFESILAVSPYYPPIHRYNDSGPSDNYNAFASLAGCGADSSALDRHNGSVFDCLVAADTAVLQNASGTVSTTRGYFGSFAFLPVIDDDYILTRPSEQLARGQVSGRRLLVGNNANDGVPLTNPRVTTREAYDRFVATSFPLLTPDDITSLNRAYHIELAQPGDPEPRFDTAGDGGPTALNQSEMATGIQQTVFDLSAESGFDCPAQWLAEAFSSSSRQAWKYQYSVTPAYHGADLAAYFSVGASVPDPGFRSAFQKILGGFVMHNSPVISVGDATAGQANATVPVSDADRDHIFWPAYQRSQPRQMDLNTTGGTTTLVTITTDLSFYERTGPGVVNTFRLVDALSWEGGRGERCDFWRSVSARVPQ